MQPYAMKDLILSSSERILAISLILVLMIGILGVVAGCIARSWD